MEHPTLECANKYIENFFRYRWQNIRDLSFEPSGKIYKYPGIYEGYGSFKKHISYSAAAHMREVRWFADPARAQGSILNFIANQRLDGSFPGHIAVRGVDEESFYHADWGNAVLELHVIHPDIDFLKKVYPALVRYADYFERTRNFDQTNLYDVVNHYETGQEFSPRYTAVHTHADRFNWGNVFRLKGVDATTYIHELYRALSKIAGALGKEKEVSKWLEKSSQIKQAMLKYMWDPQDQMFFDLDPLNERRTRVKSLTCFYPYMTNSRIYFPTSFTSNWFGVKKLRDFLGLLFNLSCIA